eukprot:GHVL01023935.1.p1 GENE.GHVL01023935.1~~GHVL01023935.1.p1  ORF type:complete len:549 (+),score=111.49 GHVL01023935.1:19-1665(+)
MGKGGGKRQHQKDKLYITNKEFKEEWGGHKKREQILFKALPFYCCGLSLLPFEDPVCTKEGIVFDIKNILPYIETYRRNPVSGQTLTSKELIPLQFHKNAEGEYMCPITYKVFNDYSHIVANKKSGHVYIHDAIERLNRETKCWNDLITGEPFTYSDLITIQNPQDVEKRRIAAFHYIKLGEEPKIVTGVSTDENDGKAYIRQSFLMRSVLKLRDKKESSETTPATNDDGALKAEADVSLDYKTDAAHKKMRSNHETTHEHAAAATSTAVGVSSMTYRQLSETEILQQLYARLRKAKSKGYVRLITSLGNLNIELFADWIPIACDNFIRHCEQKYYKNTIFHRCIKNFMIQGGDPEGTGLGGKSAFDGGEPFRDECDARLIFKGEGLLAMANCGKNSNKSQFFITFKSCEHLNNKHTIFGRVVGGKDVLHKMDDLKVDKHNKPINPPVIIDCEVFSNPFQEMHEKIAQEKIDAELAIIKHQKDNSDPFFTEDGKVVDVMAEHPQRHSKSVGKYMGSIAQTELQPSEKEIAMIPSKSKNLKKNYAFSDW